MQELGLQILMLSRQEMFSLSQALNMTTDMIEGCFDEDSEPASPHVCGRSRCVKPRRNGSGSDPNIPATIWLTAHENEIPDVAHALESFLDGHSDCAPAGVRIADLKAVLAQM